MCQVQSRLIEFFFHIVRSKYLLDSKVVESKDLSSQICDILSGKIIWREKFFLDEKLVEEKLLLKERIGQEKRCLVN